MAEPHEEFTTAPLVSISGQFALTGPRGVPLPDQPPSATGVRPWGLRDLAESDSPGRTVLAGTYCPVLQLTVDPGGRPLVDNALMGDPTANTTGSVDGEDPPSSEDWTNDYVGDDPGLPA